MGGGGEPGGAGQGLNILFCGPLCGIEKGAVAQQAFLRLASPQNKKERCAVYLAQYSNVGSLTRRFSPSFLPSLFLPYRVLLVISKVFDTAYVCFAEPDASLLLPSLERFNRLKIAKLLWRPENDGEKETKNRIREASVFQICWSAAAKVRTRRRRHLVLEGAAQHGAP